MQVLLRLFMQWLYLVASASTFIVPNLVINIHKFQVPGNVAVQYIAWLVLTSPTLNNKYQMASFLWTVSSLATWTPVVIVNPMLMTLAFCMGTAGLFKRLRTEL